MNKLHSWELGEAKDDRCGKCGMKSKPDSGCCRDEVKVIKLQQESVLSKAALSENDLSSATVYNPSFVWLPVRDAAQLEVFHGNGPPLHSNQDTYIRNCVFRL